MPYNLQEFGFADIMSCRQRIRQLFDREIRTVAEAAERTVNFFHDEFIDDSGAPACALVRFFKTHLYSKLDPELRDYTREITPQADELADTLRCLTLVASRGVEAEWNSPATSENHRVIPLTSIEVVEQAPMISQLITEMGLEIVDVVQPSRALILEHNDTYKVFHVPVAAGSPYIVAQKEFVEPYGIQSVLGFGGLLSSGDMFAVIMFSKVPISAEVADGFRIVGLNLKLSILPYLRAPLFSAPNRF